MTNGQEESDRELRLTAADIERAVEEGVVGKAEGERLVQWAYDRRFDPSTQRPQMVVPVEEPKGFNLVTVAYYFGAMLMISACAWFLGDKWEVLGTRGVLATVLTYAVIAASIGWWLRTKGFLVGGGLLVTVAVCLVPLIVFCIEDILGLWPGDDPGSYANYYPWVNGSWIVMELATIGVALIALRYVRFGFLTAPIAFSFWFLSMDLAALVLGETSLDQEARKWISVLVGVVTILIGYGLDRSLSPNTDPHRDDFAFWCYLFGTMAFWGGLTFMDGDSELKRLGYLGINLLLIAIAVKLRRTVFLVFGAIGAHIYLGHLAYRVFEDSFFFPFAVAFLGLSLILVTVLAQRWLSRRSD
jgi:hypothetical protein